MTFIKAYSSVRDDVVDQLSANSDVPYRATLAEAVAEFPVGFYFKSDDKGGVGPHPGELWIYQRTSESPGFEARAEGVDPGKIDQSISAIPEKLDSSAEGEGTALVRNETGATAVELFESYSRQIEEVRFGQMPAGHWDQRPLGRYRSLYFRSFDHGGMVLRYDGSLPQEYRYDDTGVPIHPWNTPGTFIEVNFIPGAPQVWYNGSDVTDLSTLFQNDPTARILDESTPEFPNRKGVKFDSSDTVNFGGLLWNDAIVSAMMANREFTMELDIIYTSLPFANIAQFTANSNIDNNQIRFERLSTNDPTDPSDKRKLRVIVRQGSLGSDPNRVEKTNGQPLTAQLLERKITVRLAAKNGEYRLQDLGTGEVVVSNVPYFPTLAKGIIGARRNQDGTTSAYANFFLQAIRFYQRCRPASIENLYLGDYMRVTLDGRDWQLQPTQRPEGLMFDGNRLGSVCRFELNHGDYWPAEQGNTGRHRCELSQNPGGMAWDTVYYSAGSFCVEEFARGNRPGDYNIFYQHHGGQGSLSPSFAFSLAAFDTTPYGVAISTRGSDTSGNLTTPVPVTYWPGFKIGAWHDWFVEVRYGANGYLKVWADGVQIIDYVGPFGYLAEQVAGRDAGYVKNGIYRTTYLGLGRSVHLFANVTGRTSTDIRSRILAPLPIVR